MNKGLSSTVAAVVVVFALAAAVQADIFSDEAHGALRFQLLINAATGDAWLSNMTGQAQELDGYQISTNGQAAIINPTAPDGWKGIWLSGIEDPAGTTAALGAGGTSFTQLTAQDHLIAEGNLTSTAVFQPYASWYIGKPFLPGMASHELLDATPGTTLNGGFFYHWPSAGGNVSSGDLGIGSLIIVAPEPATMAVLLGGIIPLLLKRRRKA